MISVYYPEADRLVKSAENIIAPHVTWVSLTDPDPIERKQMEIDLNLRLPDVQQLQKYHRRMYREDNFYCLTMHHIISGAQPKLSRITFIITAAHVITLSAEPLAGIEQHMPLKTGNQVISTFYSLIYGLFKHSLSAIDHVSHQIDTIAAHLFPGSDNVGGGYTPDALLETSQLLGKSAHILSGMQESIESFYSLLTYCLEDILIQESLSTQGLFKEVRLEVDAVRTAIGTMHNNIQSLQQTTADLITLNQNQSMEVMTKILLFVAPALLIVNIYGALFRDGFEEKYLLSYITVMVCMILTSVCTYYWFKREN